MCRKILWGALASSQIGTGDPFWDDVELLIQAPESGSTILDATGKTVNVYGGAAVSNVLGYPTVYFDGNGDYISAGVNIDYTFMHRGLIPWTVDFWLRTTSDLDCVIFDTGRGSTLNRGVYCALSAGKINLQIYNGVNGAYIFNKVFGYTLSANTLYHIAVAYDHSLELENGRLWVDGQKVSTGNKTGNTLSEAEAKGPMYIGAFDSAYPAYNLSGHLRAFRLTSAIRWTSTFTPPAWPYPAE